ncbi:MAG: DUF434 domain-containing protein [Thermodesulfobacteriota bacterium]
MGPDYHLKAAGRASDFFLEAAEDLRYLLGKSYPRPGALTFVGNRYQLPKDEREILGRGVYPGAEALARRHKMVGPATIKGRAMGVDGHNVLITVESGILGRDLIECDDGVIRDAAWVSNSYRPSAATDQALAMILEFLAECRALSIVFFLYAPMGLSGELAARIRTALSARGLLGRAEAVPVPANELRSFPGLVATSNSVLIDRVTEPIDLAGHVIRRFWPEVPFTGLGLHQSEI